MNRPFKPKNRFTKDEINYKHDRYYLELKQDYEEEGIDWRDTNDAHQIRLAIRRLVYTTKVNLDDI